MADFKPTASQYAAIHSRGSAVLVSAGAGSGKTRVLTERLMSFITDDEQPRDIDEFLVITFTRAAAGELRGRIMEELSSASAEDPGNRHLRRQSALCRRAEIGTIHGFCSSLLRQNCHLAGLAPDFRVIEDERAAAMKSTALGKVMEECYARPDTHPGFLRLADTVGAGRSDDRLCELVLELHAKMQCHARPALWAERQIALLGADCADAADTPWGREIIRGLARKADYWHGELERALEATRADEKIAAAYGPSIGASADALARFRRALDEGWDSARACLPIPFEGLKALRKSPDPELSELIKARRDECKKACAAMEKALSASSEKELEGMRLTQDSMEALLRLTLEFDAQYSKDKRRGSLLDYADLEHMAAALLTGEDGSPTELAVRVSERYAEIMVDEYQDVSEVQDTIFRAVSRGGSNLFLVGDVKQSIYRFRLAEPEIFTRKYLSYRDAALAAPGEPRRIMLQENFRSRREIIDAANAVFSLCMSRELGDIDYDSDAALKCGASYEGAVEKPRLLIAAARSEDEDSAAPERLELEAELAAAEIERAVREGLPVTEGGVRRAARYGDIAILLRTPNSVGPVFRRALVRRGIPVAAAQGGEFFSSVEIGTVMSMLALTDNVRQDIPLIAVMRSPCFGFTADELSAVRAADRDGDMYSALCRRAESDAKARDLTERLGALRSLAPDLSCAELVWRIINELDLLAVCGAMSDGERRRANLMELVELSEGFEATGSRGLHRFVLWLRRLAEKGQERGGAASSGGVRIMSVHRSKGLEFPIVFLCDLAHEFNLRDGSARVLVHPELGLGAKVTDLERRIEYPTLSRVAIRQRLVSETLSEEMRLLYVAMTRAREHLIMTASAKDPEKLIEKSRRSFSPKPSAEELSGARSQLSWLLSAIAADGGEHISLRVCGAPDPAAGPAGEGEGDAVDEEFGERLDRCLSFVYPHREAETLPSKVTATELKDREREDGDARSIAPKRRRSFREPDFTRAGKPLSGAEKGTATHLALQYMDFGAAQTEEGVKAEVERMRLARILSDREAEAVDAKAIAGLFASPIGRRMLAARSIRREFKFSLLCPAEELFGAAAGDEVLLQGVVDCCIEEDDGLVVVDYKTDSVRGDRQLAERTALYTPQLRAYAAALERIFGRRVRDCVLYFLSVGRETHVEPSGAAGGAALRDGEKP